MKKFLILIALFGLTLTSHAAQMDFQKAWLDHYYFTILNQIMTHGIESQEGEIGNKCVEHSQKITEQIANLENQWGAKSFQNYKGTFDTFEEFRKEVIVPFLSLISNNLNISLGYTEENLTRMLNQPNPININPNPRTAEEYMTYRDWEIKQSTINQLLLEFRWKSFILENFLKYINIINIQSYVAENENFEEL